MKTTILLVIFLLIGCSTTQTTQISHRGPDGPHKDNIYKDHVRPADLPTINISEANVPTFWTATATIIDTREFGNQHQLEGEVAGAHPRPAKFLPVHRKPHFDEQGPPNTLRSGLGQSQTIIQDEIHFDAIVQTGWNPPDPSLAVGPDHVVVTVNMAIAFFDKEGNEQFSANLDSTGNPGFFEEVGGGSFCFDPKCFYDAHAERFVVLALEHYDSGEGESFITMAVSDDSDPNGVWYKYRMWSVITNDTNGDTYWVDYPGFGFDDGYYYVTGNLFGLNHSGWGGVLYRILDKTPMLTGDPVVVADVQKPGHAGMQCAHHIGDSPAAFFVGRRNSTELRVSYIDTPENPSVASAFVAVPDHGTPGGGVPNPGGTISALDGRIMNAQYRDGSLWTAHGISGNDVNAVGRWYEIDLSNWPAVAPTLVQSGDAAVDGKSTFFPAIAQNKRGEVAIIVASANDTSVPTLHLVGRKQGDPLGVMGLPTLVATSEAGANGRWGDYFDMTIDPNNDTRFWYVGEYQANSGWHTVVGSATITCIEDINADGSVNITDLLALISVWGTAGDGAEITAPYDVADISDILAVIGAIGYCP